MNPVAFELFGYPIRWYGIIIAGGVLVAFFISYILAKKKELDFDIITDGFLWSFPFAIIGARLYYVAFEYKNYHSFEYIDVIMPGIILAQAIGRWGNFMNQEAHGGPVTEQFISKFPQFIQNRMLINGTYYHPTFLYESIWDLVVFLILIFILYKKKQQHGIIIGSYMVLYSLGRFFIEGLRTDSLMFFGLKTAQIVSLIGIIIGTIIIFVAVKFQKNKNIN